MRYGSGRARLYPCAVGAAVSVLWRDYLTFTAGGAEAPRMGFITNPLCILCVPTFAPLPPLRLGVSPHPPAPAPASRQTRGSRWVSRTGTAHAKDDRHPFALNPLRPLRSRTADRLYCAVAPLAAWSHSPSTMTPASPRGWCLPSHHEPLTPCVATCHAPRLRIGHMASVSTRLIPSTRAAGRTHR